MYRRLPPIQVEEAVRLVRGLRLHRSPRRRRRHAMKPLDGDADDAALSRRIAAGLAYSITPPKCAAGWRSVKAPRSARRYCPPSVCPPSGPLVTTVTTHHLSLSLPSTLFLSVTCPAPLTAVFRVSSRSLTAVLRVLRLPPRTTQQVPPSLEEISLQVLMAAIPCFERGRLELLRPAGRS